MAADFVPNEGAAIDIGRAACRKEAGPRFFVEESNKGWRASVEGDHWKVWWGPYSAMQAYMEISISKRDGKTSRCAVMVS